MIPADETLKFIKEVMEYLEESDKKVFLQSLYDLIDNDTVMHIDAHQTYSVLDMMLTFCKYELKNTQGMKASTNFIEWKVTAIECVMKFTRTELESAGIDVTYGN